MTTATDTRTPTAVESGGRMFKRARAWVEKDADFLTVIEADMTARTGRPRVVPWRALLTLFALTAQHGKGSLILMDVWRVAEGLTQEQRSELGLQVVVEYSHAESALADLNAAFDPEVDEATGEIVKDARLSVSREDLCNMIVRATMPGCVTEPVDQAIDSTDFETSARRKSWAHHVVPDVPEGSLPEEDFLPTRPPVNEPGWPRQGHDGRHQHSVDPDARDGYRSGKNLSRKSVFVGYDLHLASDVTPLGQDCGVPPLVRGMALMPAGSYKAHGGLALIDSVRRLGSGLGKVLVDRGYTILDSERWAQPLWERGIEQVLDLHTNQRVTRPGPLPGTTFVDGGLFVASMPSDLRGLPAYSLSQNAEEKALLARRYDDRAPYAFTPFGERDRKRGTQRYRGPALTGRLRCPNNPGSMRLDPSTRPTTACAPGQPCACGKTVTLGPDDLLQTRQRHLYGTTRWKADYGRRSNAESSNAVLKAHHSGLRRGSTRVFGVGKNAILLAFILGAANISLLLSRYHLDLAEPPTSADPVLPQPPRVKKPSLHSKVFGKRAGPKQRPSNSPAAPFLASGSWGPETTPVA